MKFYVFVLIFAIFSWSCSSNEENSSDSTVASVCSETSSDAEVYEIFQLGTTNCNLFCKDKSLSECQTAWGNGEKNLNYQYVAKSWTPLINVFPTLFYFLVWISLRFLNFLSLKQVSFF